MKCAVLVSKTTVLNTDASYIGDVQRRNLGSRYLQLDVFTRSDQRSIDVLHVHIYLCRWPQSSVHLMINNSAILPC